MNDLLEKYGLSLDQPIKMLPFAGGIGREIRHLYFQLALDESGYFRNIPKLTETGLEGKAITRALQVTRLVSFGACNAFCPYCKRDMQFIDDDGNVIASDWAPLSKLIDIADGAIERGEVLRFSGGDPLLFPKVCMFLSEYTIRNGGKYTSIAHNGSGTEFVRKMLPFMSSAAIDIKGTQRHIHTVLGLDERTGQKHFENSFKTQALFHDPETNPNDAILDIRTPIFGFHPDPAVPQTTLEDMLELADRITSINDPVRTFWTWRMYKPVHGCNWNAPELDDVLDMMEIVSKQYPKQWMGIRAKWHGGGMVYFHSGKAVNYTRIDTAESVGSGNGELLTIC